MIRLWEKLQSSPTLEEFHRKQVESTSQEQPQNIQECERLFRDAPTRVKMPSPAAPSQEREEAEKRAKWLGEINKVTDKNLFTGLTPSGEEEIAAETFLLRHMNQHGLFASVDNAWVAGLIPRGALIKWRSDGSHCFVVKQYQCALLTWPAKKLGEDVWGHDKDIKELSWRAIFSPGEIQVVPLEHKSPASIFLKERISFSHACSSFSSSCPPTPFVLLLLLSLPFFFLLHTYLPALGSLFPILLAPTLLSPFSQSFLFFLKRSLFLLTAGLCLLERRALLCGWASMFSRGLSV